MPLHFACILLTLLALPTPAQTLLIAAASDLAPVEKPLREAFERQGGVKIRFSFGSSGMLARQVANGAPFDVFLSANEEFIDEIDRLGFVLPNRRAVYAEGRVGLWSATGQIRTLDALKASGIRHIAMPNPRHAPYGVAAMELLKAAGLWDQFQPKLVYGENVRQAFEFASTGNADAVLTSWTLLHDKGGILLPASHRPLRQSGAVLKATRLPREAAAFLGFLTSREGQALLTARGLFSPLKPGH